MFHFSLCSALRIEYSHCNPNNPTFITNSLWNEHATMNTHCHMMVALVVSVKRHGVEGCRNILHLEYGKGSCLLHVSDDHLIVDTFWLDAHIWLVHCTGPAANRMHCLFSHLFLSFVECTRLMIRQSQWKWLQSNLWVFRQLHPLLIALQTRWLLSLMLCFSSHSIYTAAHSCLSGTVWILQVDKWTGTS